MLRSTVAGLVTATARPVTLAALTCLLAAAQTTGLPAANAAQATGSAVAARAAAVPQPGTGPSPARGRLHLGQQLLGGR
jgi:hypothetical protein